MKAWSGISKSYIYVPFSSSELIQSVTSTADTIQYVIFMIRCTSEKWNVLSENTCWTLFGRDAVTCRWPAGQRRPARCFPHRHDSGVSRLIRLSAREQIFTTMVNRSFKNKLQDVDSLKNIFCAMAPLIPLGKRERSWKYSQSSDQLKDTDRSNQEEEERLDVGTAGSASEGRWENTRWTLGTKAPANARRPRWEVDSESGGAAPARFCIYNTASLLWARNHHLLRLYPDSKTHYTLCCTDGPRVDTFTCIRRRKKYTDRVLFTK